MNTISCRKSLIVFVTFCFLVFGGVSAWAQEQGSGHSNWGPIGNRDGANQFYNGTAWEDAYIVAPHPAYGGPIAGTRYINWKSTISDSTGLGTTVRYRAIIWPCHCKKGFVPALTSLRVHADNQATAYLNVPLPIPPFPAPISPIIGKHPLFTDAANFQDPADDFINGSSFTIPVGVTPGPKPLSLGPNVLVFDIKDDGSTATAFDYKATIRCVKKLKRWPWWAYSPD